MEWWSITMRVFVVRGRAAAPYQCGAERYITHPWRSVSLAYASPVWMYVRTQIKKINIYISSVANSFLLSLVIPQRRILAPSLVMDILMISFTRYRVYSLINSFRIKIVTSKLLLVSESNVLCLMISYPFVEPLLKFLQVIQSRLRRSVTQSGKMSLEMAINPRAASVKLLSGHSGFKRLLYSLARHPCREWELLRFLYSLLLDFAVREVAFD